MRALAVRWRSWEEECCSCFCWRFLWCTCSQSAGGAG